MYFFIRKLGVIISTLILVSFITFGIFQILPGNPVEVMLGVDADPLQVQALTQKLGLDKPILERYSTWTVNALKGDLGNSIKYQKPVSDLIKSRIGVTVSLAVIALLLTIIIGVPIGIWIARNNKRWISDIFSVITQLGLAIPSFWLGILLILVFAVIFNVLPSGGYTPIAENPIKAVKSLILPAVSISIGTSAVVIRYLKNTLLDQMKFDYVRTAYSKGLREKQVMYNHVFKNALIPVITIFGLMATDVLGGSIITETVFSLPGLGSLITSSITSRDFPLIQGLVLYLAVIVVSINFIVDLMYTLVDPRIRLK